jgi:hypothetical protein
MATNKEITKALAQIAPNTEWALSGDNLDDLVWYDKSPKPSKEAIVAAIANPLPETEPTIADKLASVGLSVADLKAALGL